MLIRKILLLPFIALGFLSFGQQNTILIIADDVASDYFACYTNTGNIAATPNINALAQSGVKFTKAWSSPLCTPTRAGILTGRYPFRTGMGSVISTTASPQLDTLEPSIAKLLRDAAPVKYNAACVGKWHLHSSTPQKRNYPYKMGYNFYAGNFSGAISNYYSYPMVVNGATATANVYATTQTVNDAIDWIDSVNKSKPFFLWIAFNAPHTPYHLPPATLCNTLGLTGTTAHINANPEKYFMAALEAVDTEIGRLLQHLATKNLKDSTNIIFIGDNGNSQEVAQAGLSNHAKGTLYDYGVRIPLIVSGPAVSGGNRTSDNLVNTPDLFATVMELCRFTNWKTFIGNYTSDSRSFFPVLKNQAYAERTWIFTEQFNTSSSSADGKTIRNKDYHLIRFNNGAEAFYNQTTDPAESNNLSGKSLTAQETMSYHLLCDTLGALTSGAPCLFSATAENAVNVTVFYPNPSKNFIYFEAPYDGEVELSIFSMPGKLLITEKNKNEIDVSALTPGVYTIMIKHGNGKTYYKKWIKE